MSHRRRDRDGVTVQTEADVELPQLGVWVEMLEMELWFCYGCQYRVMVADVEVDTQLQRHGGGDGEGNADGDGGIKCLELASPKGGQS